MMNINGTTGLFLALIYGLLIGATYFIFKKKQKLKNYQELKKRILSWWVIIIICSLALTTHFYISILFFALLSFIALSEYIKMVPVRDSDLLALLCVFCAIIGQYYLVFIQWYGLFIVFIPVYMYFALAIAMVVTGNTHNFLKSISILQWGMMITIFSLSHLAFLLILPVYKQGGSIDAREGLGLVLFILFTVQFNDVVQYISGKKFGRHKIMPKVSPNKTWEGFLGGAIITLGISALLGLWLTPMSLSFALMMGVIISVSGFFGDVVISAIKRDLDIKDTGQLLPGHGGILDRIDSLTFSGPLFFHLMHYFYY